MGAKQMRGFAVLKANDPARLKEIAALGGAATPSGKRSFSKDRAFAAECGRKGGKSGHGGGFKDSAAASAAGKLGGRGNRKS